MCLKRFLWELFAIRKSEPFKAEDIYPEWHKTQTLGEDDSDDWPEDDLDYSRSESEMYSEEEKEAMICDPDLYIMTRFFSGDPNQE